MENALLIGLSRQVALRRELDVLANNVANINTAGFKREHVMFEEYLAPVARTHNFMRQDKRVSFVNTLGTAHDLSGGAIVRSGNELDVALQGDGFLAVETPNGERYTRNGQLQVNSQGELVTNDGLKVLGESGPITFQQEDTRIVIGGDGTISTTQGQKGKLKVVAFKNPQQLEKQGSSLFSTTEIPEPSRTTKVLQGAYEKSNISPVLEISRMIEVNRAYENVASIMSRTDEVRRSAMEKLSSLN